MNMEENLNIPLNEILKIIQNRLKKESKYFGVKTLKNPNDFWVYQEIIWEQKPDVIIEIGNLYGGNTLALAHLCDSIGKGRVIGIDIAQKRIPNIVKNNKRISLLEGDACKLFSSVNDLIGNNENVLIIEDSSHTYENTLNILNLYSQLIKPGGYLIVEDGIINHGLDYKNYKNGAYEAIETFINNNSNFEIDRKREFIITWNPKGYLKRKK